MVASGEVLRAWRLLGDGQTEAEGVPSQGGRGDALLRRMPPPTYRLGETGQDTAMQK